MTNYERIKQMSIEEMVVFLDKMQCQCMSEDCGDCPIYKINSLPHYNCSPQDIMKWLESEV